MPWEKGVSITPLPVPARSAYMTEAIEDAEGQGSEGRQRGRRHFCMTLFYPAVVYPVRRA